MGWDSLELVVVVVPARRVDEATGNAKMRSWSTILSLMTWSRNSHPGLML